MAKRKEFSELKKRALLAKQRLKMGYWENMIEERDAQLQKIGASYENRRKVSDVQRAKYNREINAVSCVGATLRDEDMYKKVCSMLESDVLITNPIGVLMDKQQYENMNAIEKQRYVLDLSAKYRELKDRYYRESFKTS